LYSSSALSVGLCDPVTSAAVSRLGQRITFAVHDETHSWTPHNGGVKLADTQRRNLAGMSGRSLETTNAYDPAEDSVAQRTHEANRDDVLIDFPETGKGSIRNKRDLRKLLKAAYAGAPWVDLDRIAAEVDELLEHDPGQADRFFINRIVGVVRRRPHPFSTVHEYTSWAALTDTRFSARHLPARPGVGLPDPQTLKPLFRRPDGSLTNW
jgi:hypothetical protein